MEKEIIAKLHSEFEEIVQINNETGAECWFARHSIFAWLCKNILQKCRTKRGKPFS